MPLLPPLEAHLAFFFFLFNEQIPSFELLTPHVVAGIIVTTRFSYVDTKTFNIVFTRKEYEIEGEVIQGPTVSGLID